MTTKHDIEVQIETNIAIHSDRLTDEQFEAIKSKNGKLKYELKSFIEQLLSSDNDPTDDYDRAMKGI